MNKITIFLTAILLFVFISNGQCYSMYCHINNIPEYQWIKWGNQMAICMQDLVYVCTYASSGTTYNEWTIIFPFYNSLVVSFFFFFLNHHINE